MKKIILLFTVLFILTFIGSCGQAEKTYVMYGGHLALLRSNIKFTVSYSGNTPVSVTVTEDRLLDSDDFGAYRGGIYRRSETIKEYFGDDYFVELFSEYEEKFSSDYNLEGIILTWSEGDYPGITLELLLSEKETGRFVYTFGAKERTVTEFVFDKDFYSAEEGKKLYDEYWRENGFDAGYYQYGVPVGEGRSQ